MKLHAVILSLFFCLLFAFDSHGQIPQPEEGKATIVIYRKNKFSGSAIAFNVQDNQRTYGSLKSGDVMYISADPGEHTFYSQVITGDAITLTVEEGKVYYVKATVKMGYYAGRPRFELVDERTALKDLK